MNDTELENELRALRPAAPTPELRTRIGEALEPRAAFAAPPVLSPTFFSRWMERFFWAGAGAAACAMVFIATGARPPAPGVATHPHKVESNNQTTAPAPQVSEEPLAWTDEGVQFIGNQVPARLLRRVAMERHVSADGIEVQVPREDVIVLPVAMH